MVRNGYLPERQLQTGIGPVTEKVPKVRAKTGDAVTFRSALVPPYIDPASFPRTPTYAATRLASASTGDRNPIGE
ncbi:MAG: hypothetical protein ACI9BW_002435 [Gammaproteobacteria bacterium]